MFLNRFDQHVGGMPFIAYFNKSVFMTESNQAAEDSHTRRHANADTTASDPCCTAVTSATACTVRI